jgi:HB1, ASXL, restriction endonuclease HTH domain
MGQRRWYALAPAPERSSMQEKRMRGESAKRVAIDVLRAARKPLHTKEVSKRVIESGRCSGLKGKTPEATVAAMLAVGSKPGGPFKRVDKGTYTLADDLGKPKGTQPTRRGAKPRVKRTSGTSKPAKARA